MKKASNSTMNALIVQENFVDDEFDGVEVWSTNSKDEEIRKPMHGRTFAVKEYREELAGRCLMVNTGVSQMRGYTTDGRCDEENQKEHKCNIQNFRKI